MPILRGKNGRRGAGVTSKQRFEILLRDNFTCQYCGKKAPEAKLEVDHIIPRNQGGSDYSENLITACRDCNRGKGGYPILTSDYIGKRIMWELSEKGYSISPAFYYITVPIKEVYKQCGIIS